MIRSDVRTTRKCKTYAESNAAAERTSVSGVAAAHNASVRVGSASASRTSRNGSQNIEVRGTRTAVTVLARNVLGYRSCNEGLATIS